MVLKLLNTALCSLITSFVILCRTAVGLSEPVQLLKMLIRTTTVKLVQKKTLTETINTEGQI